MDLNTDLLLQKSAHVKNWEDEESASYDLEALREEFQKRLHGTERKTVLEPAQNGTSGKKE
jgi:hypothetical protein